MDQWEQIGKAENIYDVQIEDKDISDFEEELEKEGVENLFFAKINSQAESNTRYINDKNKFKRDENKEVKSIEEYIDINKNVYENQLKNNQISSKNIQTQINNFTPNNTQVSGNYFPNTNQIQQQPQMNQHQYQHNPNNFQQPQMNQYQHNPNNFQQPQMNQYQNQYRHNPNNSQQPQMNQYQNQNTPNNFQNPHPSLMPNSYVNNYSNTQFIPTQNISPSSHIQKISPSSKKQNNNSTTKQTKNINTQMQTNDFKSFKIATKHETFIQNNFLNLNFETLYGLFEHISQYIYDKTELINKKTKKTYVKQNLKENLPNILNQNYTIKKSNEKITIRLFKNIIVEFDRRRIELMCSRIVQHNGVNNINIVYNCKRDPKSKDGYCVFLIFVENQQIGALITNIGLIENQQVLCFYTSFLSLALVEIIQICCHKHTQNLLYFNLVFAKKFELENKISIHSKNNMIKILTNLIDGKFCKFNGQTNNNNLNVESGEEYNTMDKSKLYKIPNLKFYSIPNLYPKYFRQYFSTASELQWGTLCFKI